MCDGRCRHDCEPVCICDGGTYCPSIWVCGETWVRTPVLEDKAISVVVRCLNGPERPDPSGMAGRHVVSGACFAAPPGGFDGRPIARMCKQIDDLRGSGAVMFYCRAGRHRSFAAAVAYILWCCRTADIDTVVRHAKSLNDRFEVLEQVEVRKGKPRRALERDLRAWQAELRLCSP